MYRYTAAINRAIQQIYKSTVSPTDPRARRTIYFPGGTYLTSNPILIPPFAKLVGDGLGSVIIRQSQGNRSVANVCDSGFQTSPIMGSGSTILPRDIEISGIQFLNSNTSVVRPVFVIDSASNVKIKSCKFIASPSAGFYPNLVSLETSAATTSKITFDSCEFVQGGNGISIVGSGINTVRLLNSAFDNLSNIAVNLNNSKNFTSIGNYFGTTGGYFISDGNNFNLSIGDYYDTVNPLYTGLRIGNLLLAPTQQTTLTSTPVVLTPLSNTATSINYEIRNAANARFGTFSFTKTNTAIVYYDNYVETAAGLTANMTANADSILISVDSGSATFKYNYQTFL